LRIDESPNEELRKELVQWVRKEISAIAAPDLVQWAPGLPKTRSGKNHAAHFAQDRRRRARPARRHLDPRRPGGGRHLVGNRQNRAGT